MRLAKRLCPGGTSALDFGSSVGELGRLLPRSLSRYDFIEENDAAARYLLQHQPQARRQNLEAIPQAAYDWVFAIDALEHNDDYPGLLARLARSLTPTGVLVISGPTENWLYRLGRRIAGFDGHYHTTTIFAIEDAARKILRCRKVTTIVPGLPLFRLSVWSALSPDEAEAASARPHTSGVEQANADHEGRRPLASRSPAAPGRRRGR